MDRFGLRGGVPLLSTAVGTFLDDERGCGFGAMEGLLPAYGMGHVSAMSSMKLS